MFLLLLGICTFIIDVGVLGHSIEEEYTPINTLASVVTLIPSFSVSARRLHDINRSGWWVLLYLTIIGIILFSTIAWVTGLAKFNGVVGSIPEMGYFLEFDLSAIMTASGATVVFSLLFVDILDTNSTLTAIAKETGRIDKKRKHQRC